MESNREEAERCVRIATAAMEAGDTAKARKFILIAQRLKPDPELDELLGKLDASEPRKRNGEYREEEARSADPGPSPSSNGGSTGPSADQVLIVKRINRTVDYYEILGLSKECTEDEVRKAYRKLSLKVHPDKNKAPGAEEAFKAVSKAFQCLSSVELRERYDRYGPEETRSLQQQQYNQGMRNRRYHHNDFFDEMFDPDEIFQAFFFGGQGRTGGFRRQQFRTPGRGAPAGGAGAGAGGDTFNYSGVIHLLLIILVIVLTSLPMSQPSHYSLQRQHPYVHKMVTRSRGVDYFVRSPAFADENPPGSKVREQVERQVETDYRDYLLHNCRIELNLRSWGQVKETPHCTEFHKFDSLHQPTQVRA